MVLDSDHDDYKVVANFHETELGQLDQVDAVIVGWEACHLQLEV